MPPDIIKHYPVMLNEVLSYLEDNKVICDCTFGGGGYSSKILEKFTTSSVIGIDRDSNILDHASNLKKKYFNRFNFFNIKFSQINKIKNLNDVDYFLFDLGLSNFQLKNLDRGFSFQSPKKLDMTMGLNTLNAYDLIQNVSEKDLTSILKFFGEEKFAYKISKGIVKHRLKKKISSGDELSNIINGIKFKRSRINPSTKSFQAIRMIVNQELSEIYIALKHIIENCKLGAVIVIVTFHSLEDILVKRVFNYYGKKKSLSRYIPVKKERENISIDILTKKACKPSEIEIKRNPNSRSAKLRVIKKVKNPNIILNREDLNMEKYFYLEELYA